MLWQGKRRDVNGNRADINSCMRFEKSGERHLCIYVGKQYIANQRQNKADEEKKIYGENWQMVWMKKAVDLCVVTGIGYLYVVP